jgi:hypothetical protein
MNTGGSKSQCGLRHAVAGTAATPATTGSETADDQGADDKRAYTPEELMEGTGRVRHGGSRGVLGSGGRADSVLSPQEALPDVP